MNKSLVICWTIFLLALVGQTSYGNDNYIQKGYNGGNLQNTVMYEKGTYIGIGTTLPTCKLNVMAPSLGVWFESESNGSSSLYRTMQGLQLSVNAMDNAFNKYGLGIKFMSKDPQFTTENPKFLSAIIPRATEYYSADTDGGMALDFYTTPENPGSSSVPSLRMTIDDNGNVGINDSTPSYKLEVNGDFKAIGLRLEDAYVPNVIGGRYNNSVNSGRYGATISGGGANAYPNTIDENYTTIGGGYGNDNDGMGGTISGGGVNDVVSGASYGTVGGGSYNRARSSYSTVSGGYSNDALGSHSVIGGGYNNVTVFDYSTVGGGYENNAYGYYSVVPGGYSNYAPGDYSFAAGHNSTSIYTGSFVWSDHDSSCSSTATDQFMVCADGGAWFSHDVSALSYHDRTPYPDSIKTAYNAVLNMRRLPDGQYDQNDESKQLDHSSLTPFVYSEDPDGSPVRNLSATVSAQNEVIKDLVVRIVQLENIVMVLEAKVR